MAKIRCPECDKLIEINDLDLTVAKVNVKKGKLNALEPFEEYYQVTDVICPECGSNLIDEEYIGFHGDISFKDAMTNTLLGIFGDKHKKP